jgi:hypothetical protein
MLTWDTINNLVEAKTGQVKPLLIGLVVEEIEEQIDVLQTQRETRPLNDTEDELLRGFVLKRYLLVKKLRDYFRVRDYDDYGVTEQEVIDSAEPTSKRGMKKCSPDQRSKDTSKKAASS